jgi:hypothetical protein
MDVLGRYNSVLAEAPRPESPGLVQSFVDLQREVEAAKARMDDAERDATSPPAPPE